jgi:hypothetical protein
MKQVNDYMAQVLFKNILRDFCSMQIFCPITEEILDYRDSVIFKQGDSEQVISNNGIKKLKEKHGDEKVEKYIATVENYMR